MIARYPLGMRLAGATLLLLVFAAAIGPLVAGSPTATVAEPFAPASWQHPFGTDVLGRDTLTRVLYGLRLDLILVVASAVTSVALGGAIGLIAGYRGGWIDQLAGRLSELFISIPFLLLALLVIAAAGPELSGSPVLLVAVVMVIYVPRTIQLAREIGRELAVLPFVEAAVLRGESTRWIAARELLPNATGVLLVEFGVRASYVPIVISSLGYLGFGVRPPTAELGLLISENKAALASAPLSVLAPLATLTVLIVAMNVFVDGWAHVLGESRSEAESA